jgi:hypothetical protein
MSFLTFNDIQGDTVFVNPSAVDVVVAASHEIPVEVDAQGQPTSDERKLKFFAVAILRNGRQVQEAFDTTDERDAKIAEVKSASFL